MVEPGVGACFLCSCGIYLRPFAGPPSKLCALQPKLCSRSPDFFETRLASRNTWESLAASQAERKKLGLCCWVKYRKDLPVLRLVFTLCFALTKKPTLAKQKCVRSAFQWLSRTAGRRFPESGGSTSLVRAGSFPWAHSLPGAPDRLPAGVSRARRARPPARRQMRGARGAGRPAPRRAGRARGCRGRGGRAGGCSPWAFLGLRVAGHASNETAECRYFSLRDFRTFFFYDLIGGQNARSLNRGLQAAVVLKLLEASPGC